MQRPTLVVVIAGALLGAPEAFAQVTYSGSTFVVADQSETGDRTNTWYLVNSLDASRGPVRITAMVPIVSQEIALVDAESSLPQGVRFTGLGDPVFRVDLDLPAGEGSLDVQIGALVKAPVRSVESGLGSGQADVAVSTTLLGGWGRNTWLLDTSYWVIGDTPDVPLRNTPAVYVGYGRILDDHYRWSVVGAASWAAAVVEGLPAATQITATALRLVGRRTGVGMTVAIGLSEGAPDLALGLSWSMGFDRRAGQNVSVARR